MVKIATKIIAIALISIFTVSCTSLKCKNYVGTIEPLEGNNIKEESMWQFNDEIYYLRVIDPESLIASSLKWDDTKKEYNAIKYHIVLTKLDDHFFLNIKKGNDDLYTILRLSTSVEGIMVVFTIDSKYIKKHIEEGKVKAIEKGDDFILDLPKEELDKYVRDNVNNLFDYDKAGILKLLKRIDDKK